MYLDILAEKVADLLLRSDSIARISDPTTCCEMGPIPIQLFGSRDL